MTEAVLMTESRLRTLLAEAAEAGARAALAKVGLHDEEAADDVKELRGLLGAWRDARQTAWSTVVRWATVALLTGIAAAVGIRVGGAG